MNDLPTHCAIQSIIDQMKNSPIRNYIAPGLTSYLIGGGDGKHGVVRMFESERDQQEAVTPHSHRFAFWCLVLQGQVTNRLWRRGPGDLFRKSELTYQGEPGEYDVVAWEQGKYVYSDEIYEAGAHYSMSAFAIHSIYFGRDTKVLFFEGPESRDVSEILEPIVDGVVIPTFKTEPWMFKKYQRSENGGEQE